MQRALYFLASYLLVALIAFTMGGVYWSDALTEQKENTPSYVNNKYKPNCTDELKQNSFKNIKVESVSSNLAEDNCKVLSNTIEARLFDESYPRIFSADFQARSRSLKALAYLDTDKAKSTLLQIILNESEDSALRRDLIRNMNWSTSMDYAMSLLSNTSDDSIKVALVLAVQDSAIAESEKLRFEDALTNLFKVSDKDFVQIAIIDYFANKNRQQLLLLASPNSSVSEHLEEVKKYSIQSPDFTIDKVGDSF